MSDGVSIYECTCPEDVTHLVQSGRGVFGIALGRVLQEVEAALTHIPSGEGQASEHPPAQADDPNARRDRRTG